MAGIDAAAYPHIVEGIIDSAPPVAVPALRLVSRAVRERIDARLGHHVVLAHYGGEPAPASLPEHARLLTPSALQHTRVVQLCSWSGQDGLDATAAEAALLALRGVTHVVMDFAVREHSSASMPRLRAGQTAVHPIRAERARQVHRPVRVAYQDVVGSHAHRIVFVLRADPRETAAICSVFYDASIPKRDFAVCLLPPPGGGIWLDEEEKTAPPLLDTLAVSAANLGTLTIAGLETWGGPAADAAWRATLVERLERIANGMARRGRVPNLSLMTLAEWRSAVGEDEWTIVNDVV